MTTRICAARRAMTFVAALALTTSLPGVVAAHAELQRAIPADGETVTEPVTVITARYSENVVGNSNLRVLASDGTGVATGAPDPADPRRMIARPSEPLTSGTFTVRSTAASADGHVERTSWTFTVAVAASPSPSALPSPSASPSEEGPSASPPPSASAPVTASLSEPSPSPSGAPSDPTARSSDVLLPILAALAIVAFGAGYLLRRGRPG